MKISKVLLVCLLCIGISGLSYSQCNHSTSINSYDSMCNGDGTSTVTINVTVIFGNGNNSATISYDIGAGNVVAIVLEDDDGDIVNQDYMFIVPSCDNYTVTLTAWTNPSGSGSSCSDPPPIVAPVILPVTFGDIDLKLSRSTVEINWTTYSEVNNERFEIQRSRNGFEFKTIGTIKVESDSYELKEYDFEDELMEYGRYYYRIKQIDLDDQFSFSEIKELNYRDDYTTIIHPNPANETIFISSSQKHFDIFNAFGQYMKGVEMINEKIAVDISGLDKGLYFLISSDKAEVQNFVKY